MNSRSEQTDRQTLLFKLIYLIWVLYLARNNVQNPGLDGKSNFPNTLAERTKNGKNLLQITLRLSLTHVWCNVHPPF